MAILPAVSCSAVTYSIAAVVYVCVFMKGVGNRFNLACSCENRFMFELSNLLTLVTKSSVIIQGVINMRNIDQNLLFLKLIHSSQQGQKVTGLRAKMLPKFKIRGQKMPLQN